MRTISKYFFSNFNEPIQNFHFYKTIPFCTFSDLEDPKYDLIERILDKLSYNKETFVSIGNKTAPFGITVNPTNTKDLETLLNSCQFSFCLTEKTGETDYILRSVLGGIWPICFYKHPYIKKIGLIRYAVGLDYNEIVSKIKDCVDKRVINDYYIWCLSKKYHRQCQKMCNENISKKNINNGFKRFR